MLRAARENYRLESRTSARHNGDLFRRAARLQRHTVRDIAAHDPRGRVKHLHDDGAPGFEAAQCRPGAAGTDEGLRGVEGARLVEAVSSLPGDASSQPPPGRTPEPAPRSADVVQTWARALPGVDAHFAARGEVALHRVGDEPRAPSGARLSPVDDDLSVVQRCQEGDRSAFVSLFRRHRVDVARLIQRMLGPGNDVEDLVQDVFVQVYKSIGRFRGTARFSTWLYRVTVNVVLMHRRALRSRPNFTSDVEEYEPVDAGLLPDEQAVRNARVRALYRLLDKLSEKKRTVFVLHEVEGLSPAQIAEAVAAPVLTVRTRLFYARREVLQLLLDEPELRVLSVGQIARGEQQPSTEEPA